MSPFLLGFRSFRVGGSLGGVGDGKVTAAKRIVPHRRGAPEGQVESCSRMVVKAGDHRLQALRCRRRAEEPASQ
jgi:hypothetical protein